MEPILTSEAAEEIKHYRKRVKGFAQFGSNDDGEDEFIEVPDECPNVCNASGILIETFE